MMELIPLERTLRWQQEVDGSTIEEQAVLLWEAEVLFKSGRGQGGCFFAHESAAAAEALSAMSALPAGDVSECQIVPYACAKQFAPALLLKGDVEATRLTRFAVSPLQPHGAPKSVSAEWPLQPVATVRDFSTANRIRFWRSSRS